MKNINIAYICLILGIGMIVMGIYLEVKEMMNDHYCYTLPINEFYQESRCKKYVEELKKK